MIMEDERRAVVDTCLLMQRQGLVVGTAGNVSIRTADLIAISPSGVPYEEMAPEDVVVVGTDGARVDGDLEPSSELPLHLSVYRATDAGAITHNHAPASTALGLVVDEIPPSHYYSVMFGGAIRVAPYAGFGTDELAANVTEALRDRTGALMKNHGAITIGPTVAKAVGMLPILEYVCEVHLRAMASGAPIGRPDGRRAERLGELREAACPGEVASSGRPAGASPTGRPSGTGSPHGGGEFDGGPHASFAGAVAAADRPEEGVRTLLGCECDPNDTI